jgi:ribose transport system permease protein
LSTTLGHYSALLLGLGFIILFSVTNKDLFLTKTTFQTTLQAGSVTVILALAFLIPAAAGSFDLSIGATMELGLALTCWLPMQTDLPLWLICVVAIAACCLVGLVNGLVVVRFGVNSFIATLAMSEVLAAVTLRITGNRSISGTFPASFTDFGNKILLGLPISFVFLLVVAIVIWFFLEQTPPGRHIFATGFNPEAARLSGVSTNRLVYGSLVASAGISGIAGVVYAMQVGTYSQGSGTALLFPALAAVFFGASQFSGRFNVWGTVIAYFALAFGVKGLELQYGPSTYWIEPLFQGLALLIAVAFATRQVHQTRRGRRKALAEAGEEIGDEPALPSALVETEMARSEQQG